VRNDYLYIAMKELLDLALNVKDIDWNLVTRGKVSVLYKDNYLLYFKTKLNYDLDKDSCISISNDLDYMIEKLASKNIPMSKMMLADKGTVFWDKYHFEFNMGAYEFFLTQHPNNVAVISINEWYEWESDDEDEDENDDSSVDLTEKCKFIIEGIYFPDYVSPLGKLHERVERIDEVLDMPNNLGSVKGWVDVMKAHWDEKK
jgi:hypothetical protein